MGSKTKQSLITGAAILGSAALISKILGAFYRIPYQNITGDIGLAVYNKVYPLYSMLLILATAGFPIAISKIVSERLAVGDKRGAKRVFIISAGILSVLGLVFFAALYFGSDKLAELMGNINLSIAIKSVSFALLIVPVMAVLRGYYQGHQYMTPTAISQVIEQIVRVITILALSYIFMKNGRGVYYAGAGAVFGATTGALFAFLVLLFYWKKVNSSEQESIADLSVAQQSEKESVWQITRKILYYSIPIAIGALVLPLLGVVDSFSVSNILSYGATLTDNPFGTYLKGQALVEYSEYWFGVFTRGQPLVQFAAFFATSLFLALVPAISEAYAKNNVILIKKRTELALRITLLIGLPASIGLAVLAEPVNIMLYRNNVGTGTMAILAFTTLFSTLFITSSGILQGIGKVTLPAKNLLIGIVIKLLLNVVLVFFLHISGAAIATIATYAVVTMLNISDINRHVGVKISLRTFFLRPALASLLMGVMVYLSKEALENLLPLIISSERTSMALVAVISVGVGIFGFLISLFITGAMARADLEQLPRYGTKLLKIADKFKMLRD